VPYFLLISRRILVLISTSGVSLPHRHNTCHS